MADEPAIASQESGVNTVEGRGGCSGVGARSGAWQEQRVEAERSGHEPATVRASSGQADDPPGDGGPGGVGRHRVGGDQSAEPADPGRGRGCRDTDIAGEPLLVWRLSVLARRRLGRSAAAQVVLWTRLAPHRRAAAGWIRCPYEVRWEVADDDQFRRVVQSGTAVADPNLAHSVHVDLTGLEPARDYYYRFMAGGDVSPTGRTKTAPAEGAQVERAALRLCFVRELRARLLRRLPRDGPRRLRPDLSPRGLHL